MSLINKYLANIDKSWCGGSVQFWLVMEYLSRMTDDQTLVIYSGHPLGLFPSDRHAPRAVITSGMVRSGVEFLVINCSVCLVLLSNCYIIIYCIVWFQVQPLMVVFQ